VRAGHRVQSAIGGLLAAIQDSERLEEANRGSNGLPTHYLSLRVSYSLTWFERRVPRALKCFLTAERKLAPKSLSASVSKRDAQPVSQPRVINLNHERTAYRDPVLKKARVPAPV
jgi:hypothetical protein